MPPQKKGEKYSFKKKSNNQHEIPKSPEATVNKVMGNITPNDNYPTSQEPINNSTDEDDIMKLFDQFSGLTSPMSD